MIQKCHFIGIGGIGMSGLARILLSKNVAVSGSDISKNYVTEKLIGEGAKIHVGHSSHNITSDMTVVYTTGINEDNPEYQAALQLKCPLIHRSDLLRQLMSGYKTLAVTGSHGKTSTTALLTWVLKQGGVDPAFAVGGIIPQLQTNGGYGKGDFFVAEACESDGTFLKYDPYGAIITNIDLEHMDFFRSENALIEAFKQFMNKVASVNTLFWCGDDVRLSAINGPGVSYGFNPKCILRILNFLQKGWCISFDIDFEGKHYHQIELGLTGQHNALNAAAVFGLCLRLGLTEKDIRAAFKSFRGVSRRCDNKGESHGILFIDDYAHHPTEIVATLKAIRNAIEERRLVAVFQPHRYSRIRDCLGTFAGVFDESDVVFITDIYSAGESPIPGISSENIRNEIQNHSRIPIKIVSRQDLASELVSFLRPHDVVVTFGAGDVTKASGEIIAQLKHLPPKKLKIGLIFGGRSVEHEVSLMSARNISNSLRQDYYTIEYFGITRQGEWLRDHDSLIHGIPQQARQNSIQQKPLLTSEIFLKLMECDVLFPVLHGPFGEDGTVQGFFEVMGKAYVGCDQRSASICMDKAMTKRLALLNGISTSPFISIKRYDWMTRSSQVISMINSQLTYPVFVKPVHLGSSIAVQKVESEDSLEMAIKKAFAFDTEILVENGLEIREIEFAVFGNGRVTVFPPGEVLAQGKIFDYEAKYGENAVKTVPRASLDKKLIDEGMFLAEKAYQAVGCTGMARVDFFLDEHHKFWFNEINPIPGFTKHSLYPSICAANGWPPQELMDKLIILAMERHRHQNLVAM